VKYNIVEVPGWITHQLPVRTAKLNSRREISGRLRITGNCDEDEVLDLLFPFPLSDRVVEGPWKNLEVGFHLLCKGKQF
jgi:hypothetical protein